MRSEFDIIKQYFTRPAHRDDLLLGIGDDAAVLSPPPGKSLLVTIDTLVEGVHFISSDSPADVGHKLLAVSLSDLAAMGAEPAWATLALTLPKVDELWLEQFAEGLFALADRHRVAIVGGDTTRGPLTLSLQLAGYTLAGCYLARHTARDGDDIYVTGTLGDAGLALRHRNGQVLLNEHERTFVEQHLCRPEPRVSLGRALLGHASSAIDISDGLAADLGHILEQSGVAAEIDLDCLPLSEPVRAQLRDDWSLPLASGDDYELCFTAPAAAAMVIAAIAAESSVPITRIGRVRAGQGLDCRLPGGGLYALQRAGYQHFETGQS